MIIDIDAIPDTTANALVLAIDVEKELVWIEASTLDKDCLRKIGVTLEELLHKDKKIYLPMDWVINKWAGPTVYIQEIKKRCTNELRKVLQCKQRCKDIYYVAPAEQQDDDKLEPCDEHSSGGAPLDLCSSG